ncbi:MAG: hypothetical protein AMJ81_06775 [Phycisphaerae bacterium SM23_33]|nr:MAG: hypothetical protein AMJ81_06775 [Phycisphaerae bacterium SM23_33]
MPPVAVDGSWGEGGGQILRTSLTLSLLTGRPLFVENIRAGRPKPGLRPQHLAAVRAAVAVSGGRVEGAALGSGGLRFFPGKPGAGQYSFDIGTAGATSLVLQTVVPALALAGGDSTVTVSGGTHVPWAPTFEYLSRHWAAVMAGLGLRVRLRLERAGFYPRGGGCVRADVSGGWRPKPLAASERGAFQRAHGLSLVGRLATSIAARQAGELEKGLRRLGLEDAFGEVAVDVVEPAARSPGTAVYVETEFETGRAAFSALGRRGKPAEQVAREAVNELARFLHTDAAFDYHLADQVLLPLALADGESRFTTSAVSEHLLANAHVISLFLGQVVQTSGDVRTPGQVRVCPTGV